jgi:hypothetical protein
MTPTHDLKEEFFGHEQVTVIEPPKSLSALRLREIHERVPAWAGASA